MSQLIVSNEGATLLKSILKKYPSLIFSEYKEKTLESCVIFEISLPSDLSFLTENIIDKIQIEFAEAAE
jgi:hypothetical protein